MSGKQTDHRLTINQRPVWTKIIYLLLPAGSAAGSSAGISFTHGPILGFFAPQGRLVAPIKVKFGREEQTVGPLLHAKFDLDRFRGGSLRPSKLKKKSNFTNIIAPKGRVPCTIFITFRLHSLCAS